MTQEWSYTPAADTGLSASERLRSVRREQGLVTWTAHLAATGLLRAYFASWHRLRIENAHHLPQAAPFVVVANHASHLDALALASALPRAARAAAYPVAAGDTFFTGLAASAFSATFINALPIWRKKSTGHAMGELRDRLNEGRTGYILFPEGTRTRDGSMGPFKAGLGMLVAGTSVPVVPCYLQGAFEACPPGKTLPRPRKLVLRAGPALRFDAEPNAREGWVRVAEQVRGAVEGLQR